MTSINQLQVSYSPVEDRLLLRLNTTGGEEFRFWLTRRYTLLMKQALAAHVAADPDMSVQPPGEAREAVREFKEEAANAGSNFEDAFRDSGSFPLGETPLLARKLSYRIEAGKLVLTIEPQDGPGINIVLDERLNFNVSKLVDGAAQKAGWGIETASPEVGGQRVIN